MHYINYLKSYKNKTITLSELEIFLQVMLTMIFLLRLGQLKQMRFNKWLVNGK